LLSFLITICGLFDRLLLRLDRFEYPLFVGDFDFLVRAKNSLTRSSDVVIRDRAFLSRLAGDLDLLEGLLLSGDLGIRRTGDLDFLKTNYLLNTNEKGYWRS